ncbi:MAG: hypothetical protein ACRD3N_15235 [Terracidiphilus sp.]
MTLTIRLALSVLALLAVPAILGGKNLAAQTHAPQAAKPAPQQQAAAKPAQPRRRAAAHARAASIERRPAPESMAALPAAPPAPIWPANQPPNQAKVSWDSRGLEIEASNSSLDQILRQVAVDTGAKLQGLTRDRRIFGIYGPGPSRDVLSKLLDGSGYNVLMIGGRDADGPLEIVLSVSSPASLQRSGNNRNRSNSDDDEADPPPVPPRPPPMETPFGNGDAGKPENPQQIMEDILARQHKIDQVAQQQQDQQNNPQL